MLTFAIIYPLYVRYSFSLKVSFSNIILYFLFIFIFRLSICSKQIHFDFQKDCIFILRVIFFFVYSLSSVVSILFTFSPQPFCNQYYNSFILVFLCFLTIYIFNIYLLFLDHHCLPCDAAATEFIYRSSH